MTTVVPPGRGVYCNRTLNLRSIRAIGYDMDYTLIHYHVAEWERRAYEHMRDRLVEQGWPLRDLRFDGDMVVRGLILDLQQGNILKCNRFGFVKRAFHGTRSMEFAEQRDAYQRTIVDLAEPRWVFLNTLFSLSEGCLYAQLVDLLDAGKLSSAGPMGYPQLYARVKSTLDATHMQGKLKDEIISNPDRFVALDAETPLALLDQKHAGKKLLLITNSEWHYTAAMMSWAFDRFLPSGTTWRSLFDMLIVAARKPDFFTRGSPFLEVVSEDGLLRPADRLQSGAAYFGGSAPALEKHLGLSGDEILYVGDHMFGDVHVTKSVLRWRTALILRELEEEVMAIERFAPSEALLADKMAEKERLEASLSEARLALQRRRAKYGPAVGETKAALEAQMSTLRSTLVALDGEIAPLAKAAGELANERWGLLTRAGNDKSHLARQMERYADIYTSRVSNLVYVTPFEYLRSTRGSLPHDPAPRVRS
jgi:HAD superfamily 5'-nucleotidase-like hydrolase